MIRHIALLVSTIVLLLLVAACAPAPTAVPVPTAVPPTKAPEATKPPAPTVVPATKPPEVTKAAEATKPPAATTAPTTAPTTAAPQVNANTVAAVKADTAPKLASLADDPAWAKAQALSVTVAGGVNFKDNSGSTSGTLKAAYTADTIYFLLQYDDPTQSTRRGPFIKQADGSWKKLIDPDDKGGDNNKYYEDKAAFLWNIGNTIKGFESVGCLALCHAGEQGKAFGNKYTASAGETGDIWHWKSVRTGPVGQVDDQYVDNTKYDKDKAPEAGRKSDANTGGGYKDITLKDGKPEFMSKDAKPANAGGTYWLNDADKVAFDDSKFKPGDEVASMLVAPVQGDRGDITAMSAWKDGKYTVVISRKLVTGSKTDVQFDKLDATYYFGIAFFDNAQVRHAYSSAPYKLIFAK